MSEANVVFNFNGQNIKIQCKKEEKMKDICERYVFKIQKNLNTLLFILYNIKSIFIMMGEWVLGIGEWGLWIGPDPQSPMPKPQTPNPQPPLLKILKINFFF